MAIVFARNKNNQIYAIQLDQQLSAQDISKLEWLLDGTVLTNTSLSGFYRGPRREMITPWSTNAVEITQNMSLKGIRRIETFDVVSSKEAAHDRMLEVIVDGLDQQIFHIKAQPEPIRFIDDIRQYNEQEGLALSEVEITYLEGVAVRIGRKLTDSEVFGFSQVNSEHCRHKIFNGQFVIDGEAKEWSLFKMIRKTTEYNPNKVVSAYKDNVSFTKGPMIEQFAPARQDQADFFKISRVESVLSLKAETHNFPTTVEPFNGAATGAGGEIRDRIAGGVGSAPLAGTAVYMTSYSRLEKGRVWEKGMEERPWLYQTPMDILIKASNGASDFGNKFGQPLINGSVLTFEHQEGDKRYGFDKVIMLAGGVGYGIFNDAQKREPVKGDQIVVMGGDNYRIGMGGSAVSSVDTGSFKSNIELNAIQRSNPEMQKRVFNAIRAMMESGANPIVSIHDHGAGGHLNCLSELVEATGGHINLDKLPVGDPTLSAKEIIGNESQERMGLVLKEQDVDMLKRIADRERAPIYVVGDITGDHRFTFESARTGEKPVDLQLSDMFGSAPRTILRDTTVKQTLQELAYHQEDLASLLTAVLQLESVACKDWLTNKVDRSVTGKVAQQQNVGPLQLPLSNVGVMALDHRGKAGVATAIGHAPAVALVNVTAGSRIALAESLTNLIFAPIDQGLKGVSCSANWMWPCKNPGEDARLYAAVEAVSDMAIALGLNIPTGKDSLSMTQKYKDGTMVYSPGTVIISASGEVTDVRNVVTPDLSNTPGSGLIYIDLSSMPFALAGSSLGQVVNRLGNTTPDIKDIDYFADAFNAVQEVIKEGLILAGHDVSSGGLITTLLEMCFPHNGLGINFDADVFAEDDLIKLLFAENPALVLQARDVKTTYDALQRKGAKCVVIGTVEPSENLSVTHKGKVTTLNVASYRDVWFKTSYLLDQKQTKPELAEERFNSYKQQAIGFNFLSHFDGTFSSLGLSIDRPAVTGVRAAIIREKGVNGDREMAYTMWLAGFDVKDVHMTDLISGKEDLSDVQFIVFVGGFSNSDVLGSAKGWAGAFLYNEKAKSALDNFYARPDTMSLGVCNGCQAMVELGLVYPQHEQKPKMAHNASGKFESIYLNATIPQDTNSIMLKSIAGSKLGIWVAHGEGQFKLPYEKSRYNIALQYSNDAYPGNPNGSPYNTAGIVSDCGRHLAVMPHLERSVFPWQCGYYPEDKRKDDCTPWLEAFVNARKWVESHK
jgi:phosphoribosylformylglycinamidine synthase